MNLYEFVKKVLTTAKKHKLVNRVEQGDVYQIMNSGKQVYSSVVLTINNITKNIDEDTRTVNGYLYYIDRTTDTQDNALSIQSTAVEVLGEIFTAILEDVNWELENGITILFTEKFGDLCAGAYTEFGISLPIDDICVDDGVIERMVKEINTNGSYDVREYDTVDVMVAPKLQESFVNITENGQHYAVPDAGYEGLSFAIIDVNVPATPTQTKSITITGNGDTTITPDEGYNLSQVDVNVNVPITPTQTKSITIVNNGDTTITPDEGYNLSQVDVNVNVPITPTQTKSISITGNGDTTITPDEGYNLSQVDVNVNVPTITTLTMTQDEYDALETKDANTIYLTTL